MIVHAPANACRGRLQSRYARCHPPPVAGLGCWPQATVGHEKSRSEQRTQRIHVEDGGSRVDELRVGGQTKIITVQPKVGDVPAYEVQPSDGVRNRPRNGAETNTGSRVWNLKQF